MTIAPVAVGHGADVEMVLAGNVRLACERHDGDGCWITFVHGGLVARWTWRSQLPARTRPNLARAGRLLVYDQRGYGASDAGETHTIALLADDLLALWDGCGITSTIVVGFSLGGFVALEAAARRPEAVLGLVLESCAEPSAQLRESFAARAHAIAGGDVATEVAEHVRRAFSHTFVEDQPENIVEYTAAAQRALPAALVGTFNSIAQWRMPGAALALDCPVLVVSGSLDPAFGPEAGSALCEQLADATHVVLPRTGHTVHFESAAGFNHVVTEFAEQVAGRPA